MKICAKCKVEKPTEEYYFSKGRYDSSCKECRREMARLYNKTPAGKARTASYLHTNNGRAKTYKKQKNRIEREQARWAVKCAVKSGKLPRAKDCICVDCGSQATNYHHPSYDKDQRLNVIPLCHQCHLIRHGLLPSPTATFLLKIPFLG